MTTPSKRRTVYDAARERLDRIFTDFDQIILAFSGGKDSGALLHLTLQYMREEGITKPITVFHLDYEGQYTATTDYVTEVMTSGDPLLEPLWVCLPVAAGSAVSMHEDHWLPWEAAKRDIWVRNLPDHPGVLHEGNLPAGFPDYYGVIDYDFQARLERWLHHTRGASRTAVLIGNREQESLHRHASIHRQDKQAMYAGLRWTSRIYDGVYNAYPIHDWLVDDVWTAHARFGWSYNRLYDLMFMAGLTPAQMRVSSPFHSAALEGLQLYRVIEPAMWAKLVGRVNGANFASIYAGSKAMAAREATLPPGHTWKSYAQFLLSTLPEATRQRYLNKFTTSVKYWTETGGALPKDVVDELREMGVEAEYQGEPKRKAKYSRPHEDVRFDEYPDDIPITAAFALVPTWKRFVITILKNDHTMQYMGFGRTKHETAKRNAALARYKEIL